MQPRGSLHDAFRMAFTWTVIRKATRETAELVVRLGSDCLDLPSPPFDLWGERRDELELKNWHCVVIAVVVIFLLAVTGLLYPVLEILGLGCQTSRGFVLFAGPNSAVCLMG